MRTWRLEAAMRDMTRSAWLWLPGLAVVFVAQLWTEAHWHAWWGTLLAYIGGGALCWGLGRIALAWCRWRDRVYWRRVRASEPQVVVCGPWEAEGGDGDGE